MKRYITPRRVALAAAVALLSPMWAAAQTISSFTITDNGASHNVSAGLTGVSRTGNGGGTTNYGSPSDHMVQHWFWYRASSGTHGNDTREYCLANQTAGSASGNTATLRYVEPIVAAPNLLQFDLTYRIKGFGSTNDSVVTVDMVVTNLDVNPVTVDLFRYADANIDNTGRNDTGTMRLNQTTAPIFNRIDFSQTGSSNAVQFTARNFSGASLVGWQLANRSTVRGSLTNASVNNVTNTTTPLTVNQLTSAQQARITNLAAGASARVQWVVSINHPATEASVNSLSTNDRTPPLGGAVVDRNATISVNVNGANYAGVNNGNGTWSVADNVVASLPDGTYNVTVSATDAFGAVGNDTTTNELVIDGTAPTIAVNPVYTSDTTPALSGSVNDPGASVSITINGNAYAAVNDGAGSWSIADNAIAALPGGTYDVIASATDSFGNVGTDATSFEVTIDLTAPTLNTPYQLTSDSTPALGGQVNDTTASVTVTVDGNSYPATNNANGTWSLADNTISPALAEGVYDIATSSTDTVGNTGTDPGTGRLIIDLTAPTSSCSIAPTTISSGQVPVAFTAGDTGGSPSFSTTLFVRMPGAASFVSTGMTSSATSGTFNYSPFAAGTYEFYTIAADAAGNVEAAPGAPDDTVAVTTAEVNLGNIPPSAGATILGGSAGELFGRSIAGAGDVNGDGFEDFVVGADRGDPFGRTDAGAATLVYGGSMTTTLIGGAEANDLAGYSVSGAGDIDGDGFSDLLVGAYGAVNLGVGNNDWGATYVLYGSAAGIGSGGQLDLGTLSSAEGTRITGGAANSWLGFSVTGLGDFNGDGLGDFAVNATRENIGGGEEGVTYIFFGSSPFDADGQIDLSVDSADVEIAGIASGNAGGSRTYISGIGDTNGDGYADLAIGIRNMGAGDNGSVYILYGSAAPSASYNLATLALPDGTAVGGVASGDLFGNAVAPAGDVNADGLADFVIGAPQWDFTNRANCGAAYIIYGASPNHGTFNLATLGAAGVTIRGQKASDYFGTAVAFAGDVDGDGYGDILASSRLAEPTGGNANGRTYLLKGGPSGPLAAAGTVDLATLTGYAVLSGGDTLEQAGTAVAGIGDINGDGRDDIGTTAIYNDDAATDAGAAYVLYGQGVLVPSPAAWTTHGAAGLTPFYSGGLGGNGQKSIPISRAALLFDAGTPSVETFQLHRTAAAGLPGSAANMHWQLSTTRAGWATAVFTLYYSAALLNGIPEASLQVYTGPTAAGPWTLVPGTTVNTDANTIVGAGASLGFFAIGN